MRRFSEVILLAFSIIFIVCSLAFALMDEGTVRVGFLTIITGVGSGYGIQIGNCAAIAIEEINKSGGVKIGEKFVNIDMSPYIYDTGRVPAKAIALARKLAEQDKVLFIFGPQASAEAEALFGSLQRKIDDPKDTGTQIVVLTAGASLAGLADLSDWAFRNVFLEDKQVDQEIPKLMEAFKLRTAAVLAQKDDAYSFGTWQKSFKPAIEKHGLKLVAYEECLQGDKDLSPQVAKLKRANPDLWINSTLYMVTATSLIEAKRQGFRPKAILGNVGTIDPRLIDAAREAAEGFWAGSPFYDTAPRAIPVAKKFESITGLQMNNFGANAYEAMYMVKWAMEHAGIKNTPETLNEDRRKFRDTLLKIRNFDGLIGKINMLPNGDAEKEGVILQVKGGRFVLWKP